ncbi:MAG TPA: MauE/DoxX family redox-associated membrane protein [Dermatophilaceae bacterium]|nr:MauE/DoxX family redox-associated membrane protein [Dermatophilaceae bacterium]
MKTIDERIDRALVPHLGRDGMILAGTFLASGVMHFVKPETFESIIPKSLPSHRTLVYVSGAAELLCAAGLLYPRTRRAAGIASAAVLVAVFPANLNMAGKAGKELSDDPADHKKQGLLAASVARLPMQLPMIRTALRIGRVLR